MDNKESDDLDLLSDDLFESFEQLTIKVVALESILAVRFNLKGDVRQELIKLCRAGAIEEDDVVSDWLMSYSCWIDWANEIKQEENGNNNGLL
jgi:hypothetical protein